MRNFIPDINGLSGAGALAYAAAHAFFAVEIRMRAHQTRKRRIDEKRLAFDGCLNKIRHGEGIHLFTQHLRHRQKAMPCGGAQSRNLFRLQTDQCRTDDICGVRIIGHHQCANGARTSAGRPLPSTERQGLAHFTISSTPSLKSSMSG